MIRTQYYNVKIAGSDVTSDIKGNVTLSDTDGEFTTLVFILTNGFSWINALGIGNVVEFKGGLSDKKITKSFSGYIQALKPSFATDGVVTLEVTCYPYGRVGAGNKKGKLVFPMDKHPRSWASNSPLKYSYIIKKLAEDCGFTIGSISPNIKKDKSCSYKNSVAQDDRTDWEFMNFLAKKIECIIWEEFIDGNPVLYLKDESSVVNTLASISFYFVADAGSHKFSVNSATDKMIRLKSLSITLDSNESKANKKLVTKTDPVTGKDQLATDVLDPKTGEWTTYVFNEALLKAEPPKKRDEIQKLIESNKFHLEDWSVLQKYFPPAENFNNPSREPESDEYSFTNTDGTSIEKPSGTPGSPGSAGDNAKKQFKFDEDALKKESPEKRAEILGRSSRGELTDSEFNTYFKAIDNTDPKSSDDIKSKSSLNTSSNQQKKKAKTRRDAGFKIEASCNGDARIRTKKSYVLEGIAKYSGSYYLYSVKDIWGDNGYTQTLTFTK